MAKNPYYIIAPAFTPTSAGIKLLYILCDLLNKKGFEAYIVPREGEIRIFYSYNAPILSLDEARIHIKDRSNPIVINTDTGWDILDLPCKFRYLMNYIGIFPNEPRETAPEFEIDKKFFWAFSRDIAKKYNIPENHVIFTPILDTETFFPPIIETRKGNMCYLGKYAEIYSKKLPMEIDNTFYVFYRRGINIPKTKEYAEKFRHAELCYIYENTSVITEALMCGCPVVCVPNDYCQFSEKDMIGLAEIGLNGIAIGTSIDEITRAKATVHLARERILQLMSEFDNKIDYFIEETQKISQEIQTDKAKISKTLTRFFNKKRPNKIIKELKRAANSLNFLKIPEYFNPYYEYKSLLKRLNPLKTPKAVKSLMKRI
jgi:hypothetical protein